MKEWWPENYQANFWYNFLCLPSFHSWFLLDPVISLPPLPISPIRLLLREVGSEWLHQKFRNTARSLWVLLDIQNTHWMHLEHHGAAGMERTCRLTTHHLSIPSYPWVICSSHHARVFCNPNALILRVIPSCRSHCALLFFLWCTPPWPPPWPPPDVHQL